MHILANKRVQNILSWVQLPIEFGSTLNKIAAAGSVKRAERGERAVKEGVARKMTERERERDRGEQVLDH